MSSTREIAERILTEMKELEGPGDAEACHSMADALLCEMLVILGYDEIVEAWNKVDKWYA